jgi:cytochrome P450
MTALSTMALLRDPEQVARLRAEPTLIKGAVEELLRYLTIVHTGLPRTAVEDVELGGHTIRAGDGVLCMISSANRDADAFPAAVTAPGGRFRRAGSSPAPLATAASAAPDRSAGPG